MAAIVEIHVAYAYSRKHGTYYAASYCRDYGHAGLPSTRTFRSGLRCAIGDTREEAIAETVARTREAASIDCSAATIVDHGRKPMSVCEAHVFQ